MKRVVSVLAAMAIMAAMMVASALPALADPGGDRGHCTKETRGDFGQTVVEECAGGSGGPGGGGGGKTTTVFFEPICGTEPCFIETTGGGSNFRDSGRGGGGKNCGTLFPASPEPEDFGCETGSTADR